MYIYNFLKYLIVIEIREGVGIRRGSVIGDFPLYIYIYIYIYIYDDDDDIEFISTKIGSCRPLRSCGKKIIIK